MSIAKAHSSNANTIFAKRHMQHDNQTNVDRVDNSRINSTRTSIGIEKDVQCSLHLHGILQILPHNFLTAKITSKQLFAYHQLECCVSSHGFFPCEWIRIVSSELLLYTWKSSIMSAYNWMKMNTFVEYESHFYRAKVTQLVSTQEFFQSHARNPRDFFFFSSLFHCLVVCLPAYSIASFELAKMKLEKCRLGIQRMDVNVW